MRLAYSFQDSGRPRHMHRGLSDQPGQMELQEAVWQWNEIWRSSRPVLQVYDEGNRVRFFDTRPCASQRSWTAGGLEAEVYSLCDSAQTRAALIHQLSARPGAEVSKQEIDAAIDSLLETKVLLSLNGKLLALGVSPNELSRH